MIDWQKMLKSEDPAQYDRAVLFNLKFQQSKACREFRRAWVIPETGFKTYKEWSAWQEKLIDQTNEYYRSDKYKSYQARVAEKRLQVAHGKITDIDLRIFAMNVWRLVPLHKYDYDIDQITLNAGVPVYWRDFVEQCLFFQKIEDMVVMPISKPELEPKLKWDFASQCYDLIVENVFPDTAIREFTNKSFGRKLKELQKKLPGYQAKRTRRKKTLEPGMKVLELDKQSGLHDSEKADIVIGEIDGRVLNKSFGEQERKRAAKLRQWRRRAKIAAKPEGDTKRNR